MITLDIEDLISGDKFIEISDHQYNKMNDYSNIYSIPYYNKPIIVYCHTEFVNRLFEDMKNKPPFILISHNGDGKITNTPGNCDAGIHNMPTNLVCWFGANVRVLHSKIIHIPTGLENRCWFPETKKQTQIANIVHTKKQIRNLCYMNFNIDTNTNERSYVYNLFKSTKWTTVDMRRNGTDFKSYLDNIYNHKFVLCPEGNTNGHPDSKGGSGSHRFWECLYCNTIPIVKRGIQTESFSDLPVLMVDDWSIINDKFLEQEYYNIKSKKHNYNKMKMSYWKLTIINTKGNLL